MLKIDVQNVPSQTFTVDIEDKELDVSIRYISRGDYFTISIIVDDELVINGMRLVSGIDIFKAFNLFDGGIYVVNSAEYTGDPKMGTWGDSTELFYFTSEEVELTNG